MVRSDLGIYPHECSIGTRAGLAPADDTDDHGIATRHVSDNQWASRIADARVAPTNVQNACAHHAPLGPEPAVTVCALSMLVDADAVVDDVDVGSLHEQWQRHRCVTITGLPPAKDGRAHSRRSEA